MPIERTDAMNLSSITRAVSQDRDLMVRSLLAMLRIKAIGPENGGEGEYARGKYLTKLVKDLGFKAVEVVNSLDRRVPSGKRPNIIVRLEGSTKRRMWVISHMDTVPEGDLGAWKYPPYEPRLVKGRIYGRGAEDNGQQLIASLFGLRALMRLGVRPECDVGLVFVSDEEHGFTHGIDFLIKKKIFAKDDLVVVPDHGLPDGSAIEVVEKGIAWINVEVMGRQTHASTPDRGVNAFEAAARFIVDSTDALRTKYSRSDPLFDPPISTFEPTKCEPNTPNVNTVPGRQVFAFDFRVLPSYRLDDVMTTLRDAADKVEARTGARISMSYLQRGDAPPGTPVDSEIVKRLSDAVELVRGVRPRPMGIGGGTCAAPFRRQGIEAAVWSTVPGTAHDANEYSNVKDLVGDAQVYGVLFAGRNLGRA
jgi:succinyl-diaminopimelate desuccinylase